MIPSTIVVRGKRIGIIGLEGAISSLLSRKDSVSPTEAASIIFSIIKAKNYIPSGLEEAYLNGIEDAWKMATGLDNGNDVQGGGLDIKILGPGCLSCNRLEHMVRDCLDGLGISADIIHIHDHDEIWRHGVVNTPALLINGKVMSQGRLPTMAQLQEWFTAFKSCPNPALGEFGH